MYSRNNEELTLCTVEWAKGGGVGNEYEKTSAYHVEAGGQGFYS